MHSQTFTGASQPALSNPRFDGATTDYFGTGNTVAQNTTGIAGWQERRRFVLSTGSSVWDMAGNIQQWVSDNNTTGTGTGGDMGVSSTPRAASVWWEHNNAGLSTSDKKLFGSFGGYTSSVNAGQIYGASGGAVLRGGGWNYSASGGLFSASLNVSASGTYGVVGFRCAFVP